jgi:hypothetical protein
MFGKDMLQQGIVWKIGEGDKVRITSDRWVLDAPCHPIQPIVYIPEDMKVSALIDKNTRQWNHELISACFAPSDDNRILSIPLSSIMVSDYVSWPFTKNGYFHSQISIYNGKMQENTSEI